MFPGKWLVSESKEERSISFESGDGGPGAQISLNFSLEFGVNGFIFQSEMGVISLGMREGGGTAVLNLSTVLLHWFFLAVLSIFSNSVHLPNSMVMMQLTNAFKKTCH